ncbi:hypothetical protein BH23CHL2_BH23CHL2_09640 [soil metagenome]
MAVARRELGLTGFDLPVVGVAASQPFNVIGKESQTDRVRLVRSAIERGIDLFATSPAYGEAERILAAGVAGSRHRATVMSTIRNPDIPAAYREIDMSLHLFDGRIDLFMVNWLAASDEMLTSLARMRAVGEAAAVGVECQALESFCHIAPRILAEGIDLVSIPATLLLMNEASELLSGIADRQCGIVAYVPDGLSAACGASLDDLKVNAGKHGLQSVADVILKMALSHTSISSVAVPVRRPRELDRLEDIASSPVFNASEMAALRTH